MVECREISAYAIICAWHICLSCVALASLLSQIKIMLKQCNLSVPPGQSTSSIPLWRGVLQPWPSPGPLSPAHCFPIDPSHRQRKELLLQWSPWWPVWKSKDRGRQGIKQDYSPLYLVKNMSDLLKMPLRVTIIRVRQAKIVLWCKYENVSYLQNIVLKRRKFVVRLTSKFYGYI